MEYEGKCSHPHGHNATAEVFLVSEDLDDQGMVCDFGEIDKNLTELIENQLDHRMLLRWDDPLVGALRSVGEEAYIMDDNPTAENIARLIFNAAEQSGLPIVAVKLWETPDSMAEYRITPQDQLPLHEDVR
jgi:6-pyruvoyltetrahydropterin/6-carboxytetrahydropterin synthase